MRVWPTPFDAEEEDGHLYIFTLRGKAKLSEPYLVEPELSYCIKTCLEQQIGFDASKPMPAIYWLRTKEN